MEAAVDLKVYGPRQLKKTPLIAKLVLLVSSLCTPLSFPNFFFLLLIFTPHFLEMIKRERKGRVED